MLLPHLAAVASRLADNVGPVSADAEVIFIASSSPSSTVSVSVSVKAESRRRTALIENKEGGEKKIPNDAAAAIKSSRKKERADETVTKREADKSKINSISQGLKNSRENTPNKNDPNYEIDRLHCTDIIKQILGKVIINRTRLVLVYMYL